MKKYSIIFFLGFIFISKSQNINVNNDYLNNEIRFQKIIDSLTEDYSLNIWPIDIRVFKNKKEKYFKTIIKNKSESLIIKSLGIDYFFEYNTLYPYKKNNGTMIPNRGYQHIISPGLYFKIGPLSATIKPEHHYSQNINFDGFWDDHYSVIWAERYKLWNHIDMPERFGTKRHNKTTLGQSNIKINWKNLALGVSSENIWWGPSIRNSIMMSNNAQGFKHITFNTIKPIQTFLGNFEFQLITGRLDSSGFTPPRTEIEHAGTKLYKPKTNQVDQNDDWRYLQGYIVSFSPKFVNGFSFGLMRWVQMYGALVEGRYWWMEGDPTYFPAFSNLFRKNDRFENLEAQTNQAAGLFFNWIWKDSKAKIYTEFHFNDAKQNLRDLILDTDHSRAITVGIEKLFKSDILFNWEWTQMEQNASRLIRNAGSWYEHPYVRDGFTNKGEVLGSAIGPGSNSQYISLRRIRNNEKIGLALEIIDQDNDFFHDAFSSAEDYRRYWKDFNFHISYEREFKKFLLSSNLIFVRSLNYQWELDDNIEPYYHPGRDANNLHISVKLTHLFN